MRGQGRLAEEGAVGARTGKWANREGIEWGGGEQRDIRVRHQKNETGELVSCKREEQVLQITKLS